MVEKPEVREGEALILCVQEVWLSIGLRWSGIRRELEALPLPPGALAGAQAPYELMLAAMGLQIHSLEDLLPVDQAGRVRDLLLAHLASEQGRGAVSLIESYEAAWRDALARRQAASLGPALLIARRLGYATPSERHPDFATDPVLQGLSQVLEHYGDPDWWRRLLMTARLVPDEKAPDRFQA